MDVAAIDQMLFEQVPFSHQVGAHLTSLDAESAEAVLTGTRERLNHVGTIHAVAQFGLGEVASGGLVIGTFSELLTQGYAPVVAHASVSYLKASRGDLRAVSRLARADQETARAQLAADDRARLSVPVQIFDSAGQLVSEMTFDWVLLKPRAS